MPLQCRVGCRVASGAMRWRDLRNCLGWVQRHTRCAVARLLLVALCAALLFGADTAAGHYAIRGAHTCRAMSLEPGTDLAAFAIKAKRLRCRDAAKVIRRRILAGDRTPYNFACRARVRQLGDRQNAQAHTDHRCRRGAHALVFAVT
jgi:hypothetical protein